MGVGPAELIVILVVALVFVGPERLPRLAADIARTIREIRKYTGNIAAEFSDVIKEFENETAGERSQWKEIGEGLTGATRSVTDAIRAARSDAEAAPPAAPPSPALPAGAAAPDGAQAIVEGAWREIPEPPPVSDVGAPAANGAALSQAAEEAR